MISGAWAAVGPDQDDAGPVVELPDRRGSRFVVLRPVPRTKRVATARAPDIGVVDVEVWKVLRELHVAESRTESGFDEAVHELACAMLAARWRIAANNWGEPKQWTPESLKTAANLAAFVADAAASRIEDDSRRPPFLLHERSDIQALYPTERLERSHTGRVERALPSAEALLTLSDELPSDLCHAGRVPLRRGLRLTGKRLWVNGRVVEGAATVFRLLRVLGGSLSWDPSSDARALGWLLARRLRALDTLPKESVAPEILRAWFGLIREYRRTAWPHLVPNLIFRDLLADPRWNKDRLVPRMRRARIDANIKESVSQVPLRLLGIPALLDAFGRAVTPPEEAAVFRTLVAELGWLDVPSQCEWDTMVNQLKSVPYRRQPMKKPQGGVRWLDVPHPALARAQRLLLAALAPAGPYNGASTAFAPGRSPVLHACAHAGARAAVTIDIADFFGSVRPHHVRAVVRSFLPAWSSAGHRAVVELAFATANGGAWLPQGASTSPWMANLAGLALDRHIRARVRELWPGGHVAYTRYADDLALSLHGDPEGDADAFLESAEALLREAVVRRGWRIQEAKTRRWVDRDREPLVLGGIVVPTASGSGASLPRSVLRRARSALHHQRRRSTDSDATERQKDRGLLGWAFAATGAPGWLAWSHRRLERLAIDLAGPVLAESILAGWADTVDARQAER